MANNLKNTKRQGRQISEAQEKKLNERAETIGKKLIGEIDHKSQGK